MNTEKITNVITHTNRLFIQQGYSNTNISQIAKEAGIATGSIYHLFENKTALLQFVLIYAINDIDLESFVFPMKQMDATELKKTLGDAFLLRLEQFSCKKNINYTFHDMLSDAFSLISKTATCSLIFEHNQNDCGNLLESYKQFRLLFFQMMTEYVTYYETNGLIKTIVKKELAIRFIVETLAFWAMHLPYDAFAKGDTISYEEAKKTAVDTLCSAYLISHIS